MKINRLNIVIIFFGIVAVSFTNGYIVVSWLGLSSDIAVIESMMVGAANGLLLVGLFPVVGLSKQDHPRYR